MKKISFWVFKLSIFIILISSIHPWFLWKVNKSYFSFITLIVITISLLFSKKLFEFNLNKLWATLMLFIIAILYSNNLNFIAFIAVFLSFIPYVILVFFKKQINVEILSFCTKGLSILLIPSLIAYLFSFIITLPSLGQIIHPNSDKYIFENYFFFIEYTGLLGINVRRFSSIFLEPGYLGTCCAFLLFANNFNFNKRENKIILIALIFSLSLAGYLIFLLGLILNKLLILKKINSKVKFITRAILLFSIVFFVSQKYNDGNNVINLAFFNRLEQDSEKGIKGNNRTSSNTGAVFEQFISSDLIWYGLDRTQFKSDVEDDIIQGAGYQMYILQHGVVPVIVLLLFYLLLAAKSIDRNKAYLFLFLIITTFLQAAYPESGSWLIPFILGISNFDLEKIRERQFEQNKTPTRQTILT
jgi:hypothetical protein